MPAIATVNKTIATWAQPSGAGVVSSHPIQTGRLTSSLSVLAFNKGQRIPGSDLALMIPLVAEGIATPDGWIVRSEFLEEESYGENLETACYDFLTSLGDRLQSLRRRGPHLAPDDHAVLDRLEAVLGPITSITPF